MSELTRYVRCRLNLHRWSWWSAPFMFTTETQTVDWMGKKIGDLYKERRLMQLRQCLGCGMEERRSV